MSEHDPNLQHHFDSPRQQFDAGKLGMWMFLATEILLFGGLFCAYAVYRGLHPEIFVYAHTYLDTNLGAINTVILLCSSLTMAWGVRAAQLGQRTLLAILLVLTLCGGFGFMGIKYVEYKSKWSHGLLWARSYSPHLDDHAAEAAAGHDADDPAAHPADGGHPNPDGDVAVAVDAEPEGFRVERSLIPPAAAGPSGLAPPVIVEGGHGPGDSPDKVQVFFSIYFLMTGLHGLHVIAGMGAIGWILVKSLRGAFGPSYFTPVDLVGLYWHLVDLIWIFLFPLLYLIH